VQELVGLFVEGLALGSESELIFPVIKETDMKFVFQISDRDRNGRLGDVELICSSGDTVITAHSTEILQLI